MRSGFQRQTRLRLQRGKALLSAHTHPTESALCSSLCLRWRQRGTRERTRERVKQPRHNARAHACAGVYRSIAEAHSLRPIAFNP